MEAAILFSFSFFWYLCNSFSRTLLHENLYNSNGLQDNNDDADNDLDDDEPRPAEAEGRVEKYIGVKVKAC